MERDQVYLVEGYQFSSGEEAQKAERELAKVKALNEKLDEENLQAVKTLYVTALDQQVFETQIGLSYLRNLQVHLIAEGELREDEKPIPVLYSKATLETEKRLMKEDYAAAVGQMREDMKKKIDGQKELVRRAQQKCRILTAAVGVLTVLVIAMFAITLTGKNENILNYKNAVTNQYAEWEQELSEREDAVRQKELELGIEP